jgi:hypothetical protein
MLYVGWDLSGFGDRTALLLSVESNNRRHQTDTEAPPSNVNEER